MTSYTIGQLAKATNTTADTLRYYEKQQLIQPIRSDNGYRQFNTDAIERLQFIQQAKNLGFSLTEIKTLLSLKEAEDATCANVKQLAQQKLIIIEKKISELQKMQNMLADITDQCCGGEESVDNCSILNSINQPTH